MKQEPTLDRSLSKVEVTGAVARHYDLMINLITGGTYSFFIRRVIRAMDIRPDDAILDLGAGTGRNACLMARYLGGRGRIVGLDIGEEMLSRCPTLGRSTGLSSRLCCTVCSNKIDCGSSAMSTGRSAPAAGSSSWTTTSLSRPKLPGRCAWHSAWSAPWQPISCGTIGRRSWPARVLLVFGLTLTTGTMCVYWKR